MKVHLFNITALAAVTLASQGFAQQSGDSLERALADLNSGLVTPAQGSGGPDWSGGFRARNQWYDDGMETNAVNIDVRVWMEMNWNVTEATRVFIGANTSENFGEGVPAPAASANGITMSYDDRANGAFDFYRAGAEADGLLGLGGTAKIGRDNYTVGSGRLVGSDHWDNVPQTHAGIWYDNQINDMVAVHTSVTNDADTGNVDENDGRLWVLTVPITLNYSGGGGNVELTPYYLRFDGAQLFGQGSSTWFGFHAGGDVLGFEYGLEWADHDSGGVSGSALALDLEYELGALTSLPFVESGEIEFTFASSDDEFAVITPAYHNSAGFSDKLGRGGQWTPGTDLFGLGFGVEPAEGWEGELAFYSVEQDTAGREWTEVDLSFGFDMVGNIDSWFGIAFIDEDGMDSELVFWAVLDLAFGGESEDM